MMDHPSKAVIDVLLKTSVWLNHTPKLHDPHVSTETQKSIGLLVGRLGFTLCQSHQLQIAID